MISSKYASNSTRACRARLMLSSSRIGSMLSEIRIDHAIEPIQVLGVDPQHSGDDNNCQRKCEGVHLIELPRLCFDRVQKIVGYLFRICAEGPRRIWG